MEHLFFIENCGKWENNNTGFPKKLIFKCFLKKAHLQTFSKKSSISKNV